MYNTGITYVAGVLAVILAATLAAPAPTVFTSHSVRLPNSLTEMKKGVFLTRAVVIGIDEVQVEDSFIKADCPYPEAPIGSTIQIELAYDGYTTSCKVRRQ